MARDLTYDLPNVLTLSQNVSYLHDLNVISGPPEMTKLTLFSICYSMFSIFRFFYFLYIFVFNCLIYYCLTPRLYISLLATATTNSWPLMFLTFWPLSLCILGPQFCALSLCSCQYSVLILFPHIACFAFYTLPNVPHVMHVWF